jgi:hypothetical protein
MRFLFPIALALSLASASLAQAQAVRTMSWANSNPPVTDASPSCDALPSENALYVGFTAPSGIDDLETLAGWVDICTAPDPIVPWWQFAPFAGCRAESLSVELSAPGYGQPIPWNGHGVATITYGAGPSGSWEMARITVIVQKGGQAALPLVAGGHYLAFKIRLGNPAVGCGNCAHGACLVLNELKFAHDGGQVTGTEMDYSNYCTWQKGVYNCPFIVPAVPSSWGKVKDTYR